MPPTPSLASRLPPLALLLAGLALLLMPASAEAQAQSTLRVTVQDETQGVLVHAVVTLSDTTGVERSVLVDQNGVAAFTALVPGTHQIRVDAEGFQGYTVSYAVRRGANRALATLPVAIKESLFVNAPSAADRRDNGFVRTLTQEELDALPDDPEELADMLRRIAGPGAQIFINGFRGGRLPPKDQIQTIRFHTNSYAAEYHDAGMVRIEIITKPGMGDWRGSLNFGFRDESLNARNAFAPVRGPEQQRRFLFSSQGPLAKGKTSLSITADGTMAYDARTIVATTPSGGVSDQIRRPVDGMNATVRLEQFLGPGNTLRAEYARREDSRGNLGVGDFDLPERAFATRSTSDLLRGYNTRVFAKKLFSELKLELSRSETVLSSGSNDPTIRVLDAFTAGGAGQTGRRAARQFTVAQNVDFTIAKHALRAGAEVNGGWWNSSQQANANGLFTFSSLDDFVSNRARTYTRRVGDPLVGYSQVDVGWYLQDDFRLSKNINVGFGLRQELQTHVGDIWNVAPRAAFSWTLDRATTVRGGWGVFYDWLESNTYEQTVRVDGTHQIDDVIINPSYPDPGLAPGTRLPASRIELGPSVTPPTIEQASIGYERSFGIWGQFHADYMWTRATNVFRSVNVNAPVAGVRPDPTAGNITEIGSTGRRASDRVNVSLMMRVPDRRIMANVNYQWANSRNHGDSALMLPADSTNPDLDWGPSSQDARHRLMAHVNAPLLFGVRAGAQAMYVSALPYTITTGRDDNGDTVFNDRPTGASRNGLRGDDQWTATLRVNRSLNVGGLLGGGNRPVTGGASGAAPQRVRGTGEGGGMQMMTMDGSDARYRLDLFVQVSNLFNTTNLNTFVGNLLSPYFGQATSAGAPRRVEIGASMSF